MCNFSIFEVRWEVEIGYEMYGMVSLLCIVSERLFQLKYKVRIEIEGWL